MTSGPTFVTLRLWKRALSTSDSGPAPRRAKSDFDQAISYQAKSDFLSVKAISYQSVDTAPHDELGLEYLQQTVANDVDEANVLLESVPQAFRDKNMETLAKTSHA